jgi:bacteriocin biosynthesis cyclodehydratase domain-containing protein
MRQTLIDHRPAPSAAGALVPPPTVVVPDDFGRRVAERLARLVPGVVACPTQGALPEDLPRTGALVLAAARPEPGLAEALDAHAHAHARPFLPVSVEQPQVVVGPFVVPGESACHGCYVRRLRQHDPAADSTAALREAYRTDARLRPGGWLPALADLAAGLVAATLLGRPGGLRPGGLRSINSMNLLPGSDEVTGFTGCPTCDTADTAGRSWSALLAAWPGLLGGAR